MKFGHFRGLVLDLVVLADRDQKVVLKSFKDQVQGHRDKVLPEGLSKAVIAVSVEAPQQYT